MKALPARVKLFEPALPSPFEPSWDQGELGSCGPQSAAKDIVFAGLKQDNLPTINMPSRLFIYYNTRLIMGTVNEDSGVDNRSLMKAIQKYGWCDETLWPYRISDFKKKPLDACYKQAESRKIKEYFAVPQTLDQMRGCLAQGDPFIFGFTVYSSFMSDAVEATGIVPMPRKSERVEGGHDILFVGYDDDSQYFDFVNSWGNWGMRGYGKMPYAYATNPKLASDFWTARGAYFAPPQPDPDPSPNLYDEMALYKGGKEVFRRKFAA